MISLSWWKRLASVFTKAKIRRAGERRARLAVDALEDRALPSATIVVQSLGDSAVLFGLTPPSATQHNWTAPNLRSAIANAAQTGDLTDTIVVPSGTINLNFGVLGIKTGLVLNIQTASGTTTIDAALKSRVLIVDQGATVTAQSLIFSHGFSTKSGGAILNDGILTLQHSRVVNSQVVGAKQYYDVWGGGIDNEYSLTIDDCTIADNWVLGAALTLSTGMGQSVHGGGLYNNGILTVSHCTFSGNALGGGSNESPTSTFVQGGNAYGGAIAFPGNSVGAVSIHDSTFSNNQVAGGQIRIAATQGFGGYGLGGAIYQEPNNLQDLMIVNCTIAFNSAIGGSAQTFDLASLAGGAQGGGLWLGARAHLIHDTIADNRAGGAFSNGGVQPVQGGGVFSMTVGSAGGPIIWNTLIARNTVQPDPNVFLNSLGYTGIFPDDVAGKFASKGHNLIGDADGATGFSTLLGDQSGKSVTPLDSGLATVLANNGGPTQTLALKPTSLAIDHGDNAAGITTDQRGVKRPQGKTVDLGAFELDQPPSVTPILAQGKSSLNNKLPPQQRVLRGPKQLLTATGLSESQLATILHVEKIDWSKQMILMISQGYGVHGPSYPTVNITGLTVKNNTLTVHWDLTTPLPGTMVPFWVTKSNPATFVLVNRFDGAVRFDASIGVLISEWLRLLPLHRVLGR
jgi:hypothetical protein